MDFCQAKELKRNLAKPHNSVGRPRLNAAPRNGVVHHWKERLTWTDEELVCHAHGLFFFGALGPMVVLRIMDAC